MCVIKKNKGTGRRILRTGYCLPFRREAPSVERANSSLDERIALAKRTGLKGIETRVYSFADVFDHKKQSPARPGFVNASTECPVRKRAVDHGRWPP